MKRAREFMTDSKKAAAAVDKIGDETKQAGDKAQHASRQTDRYDRSTKRLHRSSLLGAGGVKRLAGAVAGLAVAYGSFRGLSTAVSVTTDLAKSVSGLNRNFGVGIEEGSKFLSVLQSRGVAPKAATVAITKLSKSYEQAVAGNQSAIDSFAALGITQEQLAATGGDFQKLLLLTADGFGSLEGSTKRQATAQTLLGKGYSSILPLFSKGAEGLQANLDLAAKYGNQLSGQSVDDIMEYVAAQREMKLAQQGIRLQIGQAVLPGFKLVQGVMLDVAAGANNLSQRLRKALPSIQAALGRGNFEGAGAGLSAALGGGDDLAIVFATVFKSADDLSKVFTESLVPALSATFTWFNNLPGPLNPFVSLLSLAADNTGVLKIVIMVLVGAFVIYRVTMLGVIAVEKIHGFHTRWNTKSTILHTTATRVSSAANRVWAATMWLVNAAMRANPLVLVISLIVAVGLAIVIAYRRFAFFRNGVNAVWSWVKNNWPLLLGILTGPIGLAVVMIIQHWDTLKGGATSAVNFIREKWNGLKSWFGGLPGQFAGLSTNLGRSMVNGIIDALNGMITAFNSTFEFSFDPPGPGSVTFDAPDLPTIPKLAAGGTVRVGGMSIIGERGPELMSLPAGAQVTPLSGPVVEPVLRELVGAGGPQEIVVPVYLDGREIARSTARVVANKKARR